MLDPSTVTGIDDLQDAILDWQRQYPDDPWLPRSLERLMLDYQRAGVASSDSAMDALNVMRAAYPDAQETTDTVAAIFGTGTTVIAAAPAPIVYSPPAPVRRRNSQAWKRFARSRGTFASDDTDASGTVSVSGVVVDSRTGDPVPGAVVFIAPNADASDTSSAPFAATGDDGSFAVADVPLGDSYNAGPVSYSHAEYVVVQPPRGSSYTAYHGMIDASVSDVQAGIIRLSRR